VALLIFARRMPRVAVATAAVVLAAGCGVVPGAAADRSHAANTAARHAPDAAAVRYHGVIGAPMPTVETDAQTSAQPPINVPAVQACANAVSTNPTLHQDASAYLAGWSGVSKLGGSAPLGFPALGLAQGEGADEGLFVGSADVQQAGQTEAYDCTGIKLQLDYDGQREFPPLTATFLAFGFTPVTATVYLTQAGPSPITSIAYEDEGPASNQGEDNPAAIVSESQVSLRLADVKVNGVSLDVGANCHTDGVLTSPNPLGYHGLVLAGGALPGDPLPYFVSAFDSNGIGGEATIPPFTGCVTPGGDNVDALLDASVSGPGNYVTLAIGNLCNWAPAGPPYNADFCASASAPPFMPEYLPLWTITHGGPYTATGPVSLNELKPYNTTISCTGSEISGEIPDSTGLLRGGLLVGTLTWSFSGCTGSDGSTWTITQQGGSAFLAAEEPLPITRASYSAGAIEGLDLDLTGTNVPGSTGSCTAQVTYGAVAMAYDNTSSTLLLGVNTIPNTLGISKSNCADLPPTSEYFPGHGYAFPIEISSSYSIEPKGITITSP
jgi:hypothetical protein